MSAWSFEPVRGARLRIVIVALAFSLGALVDAGLAWRLERTAASTNAIEPRLVPGVEEPAVPAHLTTETPAERPRDLATNASVGTFGATVTGDADVETLRHRNLHLPVQGISRKDLRDTFNDARGSSRAHQALDILAPRQTPVLAVQDGTVAKLFTSKAGGLTIYQFEPSQTFCYYYAHLDGYAEGLHEGQTVQRGQVIGYVGTTGNAPADTPHLHFAIFRLTPERQWWKGDPIDPYPVLK